MCQHKEDSRGIGFESEGFLVIIQPKDGASGCETMALESTLTVNEYNYFT